MATIGTENKTPLKTGKDKDKYIVLKSKDDIDRYFDSM